MKQCAYWAALCTIVSLVIQLPACNQPDSQKSAVQQIKLDSLNVGTFSSSLTEWDSCACYFAANKSDFRNQQYLFANNFGTAILKINGQMVKFAQTMIKKPNQGQMIFDYEADGYKLMVDVQNFGQSSYEASLKIGILTLTSTRGQKVVCSFYGECSC